MLLGTEEGAVLKTYHAAQITYLQRGFIDLTFFPLYGTDSRPQALLHQPLTLCQAQKTFPTKAPIHHFFTL